jgi:uncharacterized iron-regulated membrane protein
MPHSSSARRRAAALGTHHRGGLPFSAVLLPTAVLLTGLLTAGCSGAKADTSAGVPSSGPPSATPSSVGAPARSCKTPPAADVPGAAGALTQADSGTFCLALGEQIDVFLTSPEGQKPGVPRWAPIATSDAHVLTQRSSGILTAPVGVTPGIFEALTRGTVQLTSTIPGGTRTWHVAVLIR